MGEEKQVEESDGDGKVDFTDESRKTSTGSENSLPARKLRAKKALLNSLRNGKQDRSESSSNDGAIEENLVGDEKEGVEDLVRVSREEYEAMKVYRKIIFNVSDNLDQIKSYRKSTLLPERKVIYFSILDAAMNGPYEVGVREAVRTLGRLAAPLAAAVMLVQASRCDLPLPGVTERAAGRAARLREAGSGSSSGERGGDHKERHRRPERTVLPAQHVARPRRGAAHEASHKRRSQSAAPVLSPVRGGVARQGLNINIVSFFNA